MAQESGGNRSETMDRLSGSDRGQLLDRTKR